MRTERSFPLLDGPRRIAVLLAAMVGVGCAPATVPVATDPPPVPQMSEPQRQDLAFVLDAHQQVIVENPYGSIYLRFGGYEHQLDVHATAQQPDGAAPISFVPERRSDALVLTPRLPSGALLAAQQRFDLVLYVPQDHAVRASTRDGVIEVKGVRSDIDLQSESGAITIRGVSGLTHAESGTGSIEAALADHAPKGSTQRLATRTGTIIVGVGDQLDADVALATSAPFTTDFSLAVTHRDGEEPNKTAKARIGEPDAQAPATLVLNSLRGEIRLLRRAVYVPAAAPNAEPSG